MMRRLLLVRHASTRATRQACFAPEDPLDARGRGEAAALRAELPRSADFVVGPCLGAFQTASLAGGAPLVIEQALADCDYGRWAGRPLDQVRRDEPEAVEAWLTDPDAVPHGGESMRALLTRAGEWLDEQAGRDGTLVAVAPGAVVRAIVVCALGAPTDAFWRIDVSPASVTELHARPGCWTVARVNDRSAARSAGKGAEEDGVAASGARRSGPPSTAGRAAARVDTLAIRRA